MTTGAGAAVVVVGAGVVVGACVVVKTEVLGAVVGATVVGVGRLVAGGSVSPQAVDIPPNTNRAVANL